MAGADLHFDQEPPAATRALLDDMSFSGHVSDLGASVRVSIPDPQSWIDPAETDVDDTARVAI